jgi:hypothetical protein
VGARRRGNVAIEMLLSAASELNGIVSMESGVATKPQGQKKNEVHEDRGLRECREVGVGRRRIANKTHLLSHSPPPRTDPPRMTARLSEGAPHSRREGTIRRGRREDVLIWQEVVMMLGTSAAETGMLSAPE